VLGVPKDDAQVQYAPKAPADSKNPKKMNPICTRLRNQHVITLILENACPFQPSSMAC